MDHARLCRGGGLQGCSRDKHRKNWRCARAVRQRPPRPLPPPCAMSFRKGKEGVPSEAASLGSRRAEWPIVPSLSGVPRSGSCRSFVVPTRCWSRTSTPSHLFERIPRGGGGSPPPAPVGPSRPLHAHAHCSVGRQVADDQDDTRRGGGGDGASRTRKRGEARGG